jgi:prepilin-type N-terminal cleavage/methylation domain-containing protein
MLKKAQKTKSEGFTIIEVMIVLAIAGLIILIVLLAIPALQRNGRNTQRRQDVNNTIASINTYITNNDGKVPTTLALAQQEAQTSFYTGSDIDFVQGPPSTANVALTTVDESKMYVRIGGRCNTAKTNVGGAGATSRNFAVVYTIESASSSGSAVKCQDS